MITMQWDDVTVGSTVLLNGARWKVTERHGPTVTARTDQGQTHTGTPKGLVEVANLAPSTSQMDVAAALLQVQLGAQVVAVGPTKEGMHYVPVSFADVGSALAHIYLFHGQTYSNDSVREVLAEHGRLHDAKGAGYVDHIHDPQFLARR